MNGHGLALVYGGANLRVGRDVDAFGNRVVLHRIADVEHEVILVERCPNLRLIHALEVGDSGLDDRRLVVARVLIRVHDRPADAERGEQEQNDAGNDERAVAATIGLNGFGVRLGGRRRYGGRALCGRRGSDLGRGGDHLGLPCANGRRGHALAARGSKEIGAHVGGALVAILPALGQGLHHHAVELIGNVRRDRRRLRRRLRNVLVGHGHGRIAAERRLAGQQLKEQAAGRIQIRARIHHFATGLLGREILRRAHHGIRLRHRGRGVGDRAGNAKVHDLDLAIGSEHDVARLDITVNDAFAVRILEGGQHADDDLHGLVNRQRIAFGQ